MRAKKSEYAHAHFCLRVIIRQKQIGFISDEWWICWGYAPFCGLITTNLNTNVEHSIFPLELICKLKLCVSFFDRSLEINFT